MDRQELIERFYDACEFPHCARSVYSTAYYGLMDSLNMEIDDFKIFFPHFYCPATQNYKINEINSLDMTSTILERSRIDILDKIVEIVEHSYNFEYSDFEDNGYDSY